MALGIAATGQKHARGLWESATENAAVCQSFLAHLQRRGLRTDRSLRVILEGALARHTAGRAVFGETALIPRCQVHKPRSILDHLPARQRPWVRRAYLATDVKTATRLLTDFAKRLENEYPSAAGSVREGLDETLTVLTLPRSARLQRSLATTNAAESRLSRTRHVKRNVKPEFLSEPECAQRLADFIASTFVGQGRRGHGRSMDVRRKQIVPA